ncbi:MAG: hypothetical protein HKN59_01965 [Gammaproteobacteria bacterium]|nr:hypothetical protein [Gammaproteobacteria bacterium]
MIYLIGQIFFCLALVGMVGLLVGWLVRGIGTHQKEKELEATWRMRLRQRDSMLSKMANELADRRDPSSAAPRPVASDAQVTKELDELRRIARDRNTQLAQLQGKISKRDAQISQLFAEIRRIGGQPAVDKLIGQVNTGDFLDSGMHRLSDLLPKPKSQATPTPEAPVAVPAAPAVKDDPSDRTHPEKASLQQASVSVDSEPDELAFIYGISPALEKKLLKLGITRYRQIADFTEGDIRRTAQAIGIEAAQIEEENWVEGARQEHLAKYGELV